MNLIKLIFIVSILMRNAEAGYALYTVRYPLLNTLRPVAAALNGKDQIFPEDRGFKGPDLEILNLEQIPPVVLDADFVYSAFSIEKANIRILGEHSSFVPIVIEGYDAGAKGALMLLIYKGHPVAVLRENKAGLEMRYRYSIGLLAKDFKIEKGPACQWIRDNFPDLIKGAEDTDMYVKGFWSTENRHSFEMNERTQRQDYGLPFIQYFRGVFAQGLNSSIPMVDIIKSEAKKGVEARHVLDIACGAGDLGLAAVQNLGVESVVAADSDVFALLSAMINFERLGKRKALTVVYGCLKEQATWDILISKGLYDYVLFNGPFPIPESHAGAKNHIMYDEAGRVKTKLIENIHALVNRTGIAQILSDENFGAEIISRGFAISDSKNNPEGLYFYIIMHTLNAEPNATLNREQLAAISQSA